jgi:large subunit ribosomal protein L6
MSRIGNNPIKIPTEVSIQIEASKIIVKGKLGELVQEYSGISLELNNDLLLLKRNSESKDHKSKHGLYRALIANMVEGVSKGFTKEIIAWVLQSEIKYMVGNNESGADLVRKISQRYSDSDMMEVKLDNNDDNKRKITKKT